MPPTCWEFSHFFAEPGDFPAMITTLNQLAAEEGGLAPQISHWLHAALKHFQAGCTSKLMESNSSFFAIKMGIFLGWLSIWELNSPLSPAFPPKNREANFGWNIWNPPWYPSSTFPTKQIQHRKKKRPFFGTALRCTAPAGCLCQTGWVRRNDSHRVHDAWGQIFSSEVLQLGLGWRRRMMTVNYWWNNWVYGNDNL